MKAYQGRMQILQETPNDENAPASQKLLTVDLVASDKVLNDAQKSGDEKTLSRLKGAF